MKINLWGVFIFILKCICYLPWKFLRAYEFPIMIITSAVIFMTIIPSCWWQLTLFTSFFYFFFPFYKAYKDK